MLFSNLFTKECGEPVIHNTALEKNGGNLFINNFSATAIMERKIVNTNISFNMPKDENEPKLQFAYA